MSNEAVKIKREAVEIMVNHFKERFNIKKDIEVTNEYERTETCIRIKYGAYSYIMGENEDIVKGVSNSFRMIIDVIIRREYLGLTEIK